MPGKNRKKKKRSEGDDEISDNKRINLQSTPEGTGTSPISKVLSDVNSVLFDEEFSVTVRNLFDPLTGVSDHHSGDETSGASERVNSGHPVGGESNPENKDEMAESSRSCDNRSSKTPTNSDIVAILGRIDLKLNDMDKRLKALDSLEQKVEKFDRDLNKLWNHIDSMTKDNSEKLSRIENMVDSAEIDIEGTRRRVADLERDNDRLKEDMNYMRSQSMRNNLIFGNLPEEPNETPARTEQIVREFMSSKLQMAQEIVNGLKFERVHRMGPRTGQYTGSDADRGPNGRQGSGRHRSVVCKFSFFNDREMVRGKSKNLKGTQFYVSEQFPPEIAAKRRRLFRRVKEEREAGKRAWVSYDTLYVDGRPVREA